MQKQPTIIPPIAKLARNRHAKLLLAELDIVRPGVARARGVVRARAVARAVHERVGHDRCAAEREVRVLVHDEAVRAGQEVFPGVRALEAVMDRDVGALADAGDAPDDVVRLEVAVRGVSGVNR